VALARKLGAIALTLAICWLLQWISDRTLNLYVVRVLCLAGMNVILAVSLNVINGFAGQFSIGHAGFMAIGAYASGFFAVKWGAHLPDIATLLGGVGFGALVAAGTGVVVGVPSLRLKGDYLAIVTLGFGEIIRVVITNVEEVGGVHVGGAAGFHDIPYFTNLFWILAFAVLTVTVARNIARSTYGRVLFAIREDEIAAEALGVRTTKYKVLAFVLSAAFAGVAGSLFAHFDGNLDPNAFNFQRSIEIVAMIVLGGLGSISGAVTGALVLTFLLEALRFAKDWTGGVDLRLIFFSLLLIVIMLTRPQGVFGTREVSLAWMKRLRRSA
jgi:branched-chain amino acid transport system permease protein